jgi:hypothetical protein
MVGAIERGADSDSANPAGNQVEHAGPSQVNVIRSRNSGINRIGLTDRRTRQFSTPTALWNARAVVRFSPMGQC